MKSFPPRKAKKSVFDGTAALEYGAFSLSDIPETPLMPLAS